MTKQVIIFGLGDNSQIAHFYLSQDKEYEVVAFTLDKGYLKDTEFAGKPVVEFETLPRRYDPKLYKLFIPIGYTETNKVRETKFLQGKSMGYDFISFVSPDAFVASNVEIGENCFVLENNTVQPFVKIEENCILWSGNHIGHHSIIRKNCFISSQVVIAGGCDIGQNSFLGVNATLRDHIRVGKYNIIGMGAVIAGPTRDFNVFIDQPTPLSSRSSKEVKL